jgi:hypothetical protein
VRQSADDCSSANAIGDGVCCACRIDRAAGYMTTFDLKFVDKDGNPLATVSLFSSATMSDSNKKYGRINVADGTYGGITVAKYADLQQKLAALGVTLP